MLSFLIGFQIFVAILLVVVILMQNGKGADIGSAFGSGNNNGMLGPIESGNTLTTLTWILVFVFFINTLGISIYQKTNFDSELEIFSEPVNTEDVSDGIIEIEDLPEIKVVASKVKGMKCQRCWKLSLIHI